MSQDRSTGASLRDLLETHTGLPGAFRAWLDRPVPGGARWSLATCGVVASLVGLEFLTGFVLSLHYSPSVTTAWASLAFLEERIRGGGLVRGLHVFGTTALVLAVLVHFVRVVATGSYRKPYQSSWVTGSFIVIVLAGFAVTGTLLPFDQNAYWATRVRMGYAGATPLVGPTLEGIAQGGEDVGNLTLTRFYAVHAILLPAALLALAAIRSRLKKRALQEEMTAIGATPVVTRWFPGQAVRTLALVVLTLGALLAFVHHMGGAPLEAPADAAGDYEARPEWFFLPLFQLVKLLPGSLNFVGTEVVPTVLFVLITALPFFDRRARGDRNLSGAAVAIAFVPLFAAIGLGVLAWINDASNDRLHLSQRAAATDATDARSLFVKNGGVPPEGPLALYDLDPVRVGKRVFVEHCAACHSLDARPNQKGPDLGHYLSNGWLTEVIRAPDSARFWGGQDKMGVVSASPTQLAAVVDFVRALESDDAAKAIGAERIAKGRVFWDDNCAICHECKAPVDRSSGGTRSGGARGGERASPADDDPAPNLAGYGSDEWLESFIKNSKAPRFMGSQGRMTVFEDKLTPAELKGVVAYLKSPQVRERE